MMNAGTLTHEFGWFLELKIGEITIEYANENHSSQEAEYDARQHVIGKASEVNALQARQQKISFALLSL